MVNELEDAMKEGQGFELIKRTFDRLIGYVGRHSDREASTMREASHPGLCAQEQEHQRFRAHVQEMAMRRCEWIDPSASELLTYLSDWLRQHVTSVEKGIGRFLKRVSR